MTNPLESLRVNLVDSVDEAQRFLSWLGERRPCIAVDTETTGLGWTDTVRLIQFGDGAEAWAIPVRDWRGVAVAGLAAVRDSGEPVVMHNAQFDQHKLENDGFPVPDWRQIEDTLILSKLHSSHLPAGLKPLCSRLFGREAVAGQDLLKQEMAKNKWTWATVPDDFGPYWTYGALDTSLTALAYEHLRPLVPTAPYEREMAVMAIMYGAEKRGMRIDVAYTENLLSEWRQESADLRTSLQERGIENPSSDAQVTRYLKEAGWEPQEFTDTGLPKLDKAILSSLGKQYGDLAEPLLRYRRLVKWSSTYLERFLRDRDGDDRVHPDIQTMGARTGRMSIRNPALQTLPSKEASIRNCIIPGDGEVLYAIDFSMIEMRLMAHYSGDPALLATLQAGEDLHTFCASQAYGVPVEQVTKLQRAIAKNTNFSRLYGAGPAKIAQTAGVSESEIQGYLTAFDSRFPGVSSFMDKVSHTAKVRLASEGQAYVMTGGGRRLVGEPDKIYALTNHTIQGTATDAFKSAVVAVDCAGYGDTITCAVHDELIFSLPKESAAADSLVIQEAMEDRTSYAVPLTCEVTGPLERWGAAYV